MSELKESKSQSIKSFFRSGDYVQIFLVMVTISGIYFQKQIFELEKEYKEISIKPILVKSNHQDDPELEIKNIGLGAAKVLSVSYESNSFPRQEFSQNIVLDDDTENNIKDDMEKRVLNEIKGLTESGRTLETGTSFLRPGMFIQKDEQINISSIYFDKFKNDAEDPKYASKIAKRIVEIDIQIKNKAKQNLSSFRIHICYCSITEKECQLLSLGGKRSEVMTCK